MSYRGRFAPSPTGPLHAGSLVAALASWLDARAHSPLSGPGQSGIWLVRIEDVDTPRCIPGTDRTILDQLAACGLVSDEAVIYQSQHTDRYQAALDQLKAVQAVYPCGCSRKDIEAAWAARGVSRARHGELVYPGTCRDGLQGKSARAWRINLELARVLKKKVPSAHTECALPAINLIANPDVVMEWTDRLLGVQQQNLTQDVGDFVLKRADGLWAYQLAVVVDDAAQQITHVVRGQDLADNTPRQMLLQCALDYPTPQYLHTPLVMGVNGEKLSKQNGATAIDTSTPERALHALRAAAQALGLRATAGNIPDSLAAWVCEWRETYNRGHE
jgi:glutamyl-Q tRNA(Asp) synthetase